ncbi:hypothetical protein TNCV_1240331 [Trichonephila clavipes]|uniref:Uncharacterized protein n=1 Tax=Trichonephila clavipes TaxID=2585209 RepID=A0A8X7BJZ7_TRICX|nr:hypothetical protein TNCV_1240331 [Trichonephila clavipes]
MIPAYNKKRCAAFSFETGIHFRRKTDFLPEEDTTMSYSGFEPEPTRLQAEGHSHHNGWATEYELIVGIEKMTSVKCGSCHSSRHCWRSPLPHASALIQRDFRCVLGVQQTKQLPHVAKVDLVRQLGV